MRTSFIEALCLEAQKNERIFLLCGDLGFSVLEQFADQFPDRFINVGIAEQNMMQIASGLAMEGYTVFTYSIGNFPTLRCMEQIRYDICYHNLDVKIIAVGAGYAYGPLGTSHHTTEDIAMLRSIPNMMVTAPGDTHEATEITKLFCGQRGPAYMRINKAGDAKVHLNTPALTQGKSIQVIAGYDTAVFSTGAILADARDTIESKKSHCSLYSFPFITNLDDESFVNFATKYKNIYTIEEHQANGGFGSAIVEKFSDLFASRKIEAMPLVHRIAIPNIFQGKAGSQHFLRELSGLTLPF